MKTIISLTLLLASLASFADDVRTVRTCTDGTCVVQACKSSTCYTFKDASEGYFIKNNTILKLYYPQRASKLGYFLFSEGSFLSRADLFHLCPECSQEFQPGPKPEEMSNSLKLSVESDCRQLFGPAGQAECFNLIAATASPHTSHAKLVTVGESSKPANRLALLKLALNDSLSHIKVWHCLKNFSFDSQRGYCLSLSLAVSDHLAQECTASPSLIGEDRIKCLQRAQPK